jgi:hypothetical protein
MVVLMLMVMVCNIRDGIGFYAGVSGVLVLVCVFHCIIKALAVEIFVYHMLPKAGWVDRGGDFLKGEHGEHPRCLFRFVSQKVGFHPPIQPLDGPQLRYFGSCQNVREPNFFYNAFLKIPSFPAPDVCCNRGASRNTDSHFMRMVVFVMVLMMVIVMVVADVAHTMVLSCVVFVVGARAGNSLCIAFVKGTAVLSVCGCTCSCLAYERFEYEDS